MIFNSQEAYERLIVELDRRAIKYIVHRFSSGIKMIDIWYNDLFYVVQIENNFAGISLIDEDNGGFDTTPDTKIFTVEDFLLKVRSTF